MIGNGLSIVTYSGTSVNETVPKKQSFTSDGSTKTFTVTDFTLDSLAIVFVNGFEVKPSSYSLSGSTITFTDAPAPGDVVIYGYETVHIADLESSTESTGTDVKFDIPRHYGTPTTPITGNITFNFDNAKVGMTQIICHNDSSAPSLPSEAVVLNGSYTTGVDNYITLMYYTNGTVLVSYSQE